MQCRRCKKNPNRPPAAAAKSTISKVGISKVGGNFKGRHFEDRRRSSKAFASKAKPRPARPPPRGPKPAKSNQKRRRSRGRIRQRRGAPRYWAAPGRCRSADSVPEAARFRPTPSIAEIHVPTARDIRLDVVAALAAPCGSSPHGFHLVGASSRIERPRQTCGGVVRRLPVHQCECQRQRARRSRHTPAWNAVSCSTRSSASIAAAPRPRPPPACA